MGKFINPFTDVGFKRIFGQEVSKPVLIAFLNALLKDEQTIVDLQYLDKEQPGDSADDRSLIYDVYCELENGEHIIVEMQNKSQPYFKNRSVYYVSRAISRQGESGPEWRYDVKAVYLIALLNFKRDDISCEFRTDVALMDMKHKTLFSDKVRLVYLQLPYFTKEVDDCENIFEKLIFVLKHMDVLQRMPWLAQDAVFQKLASIADVASLNKQERMAYDENLRKYRDTIAVMEGQFMQGEKKGRAEGIDEADILEIIDHHNIGDIVTRRPINFRSSNCGSTCTMIYEMYNENLVEVPPNIAGLLASAIISDTLLLTSPTTTEKDKVALERLAIIAGINYRDYGMKMLKKGMTVSNLTVEEIVNKDFKTYKIDDKLIGIGQILIMDYKQIKNRTNEIVDYLNHLAKKEGFKVVTLPQFRDV